MDLLLEAISELLGGNLAKVWLRIAPQNARLRSQLYENEYIEEEQSSGDGYYLVYVHLPEDELNRILEQGDAELVDGSVESNQDAVVI